MKRKTSSAARRAREKKHKSDDKPTLLILPAELRELILIFTLEEDGPIIASVAQRTVRTIPEHHKFSQEPTNMYTTREFKAEPGEPPLATVNKQLREEALDVYYQRNTFIFHVEKNTPFETHRWWRIRHRR